MNQQELTFIARRSRGQGRAQRTACHYTTHTLNSDLTERCFLLHKTVGKAKQIYFCGDHKTVFKYYKPQRMAAFAPRASSKIACPHLRFTEPPEEYQPRRDSDAKFGLKMRFTKLKPETS
jgi:hypothetical protein